MDQKTALQQLNELAMLWVNFGDVGVFRGTAHCAQLGESKKATIYRFRKYYIRSWVAVVSETSQQILLYNHALMLWRGKYECYYSPKYAVDWSDDVYEKIKTLISEFGDLTPIMKSYGKVRKFLSTGNLKLFDKCINKYVQKLSK